MNEVAFVFTWTAGMALMMLPSAVPLLRLDYVTERSGVRTTALGAGYVTTWLGIAAAVAALDVLIGMPLMDSHEQVVVVAALAVAAAYQASPLKRRCLARCRSPLSRIFHGWRDGISGAFRMEMRMMPGPDRPGAGQLRSYGEPLRRGCSSRRLPGPLRRDLLLRDAVPE